jgi:acetyltransferase-like isoleucine patch superfamily enzyme
VNEHVVSRGLVDLHESVRVGAFCVFDGETRLVKVGPESVIGSFVSIHGGVDLAGGARVGDYVELGHPTKAQTQGADPTAALERVADLVLPAAETVIGPGCIIRSHSVIYSFVSAGARLITGHGAVIREHTTIGDRCVFGTYASCDGYTRIGDDVQVGQYAQLSQAARIGSGCFIGGHTVFSDNRMAIRAVEHDLFGAVVDDYVRIGLACVILPGVTIGADAVVGAGSVVTKDVPARSVAAGNPCRVLRELRDEEAAAYRASVGSA